MRLVSLTKSSQAAKKYTAVFSTDAGGTKTVHFGAEGYLDYTQHGDPKRKELYIQRHAATGREQWDNIHTAGFWSRWLLWDQPTLQEAINKIEKKFKITIKKI